MVAVFVIYFVFNVIYTYFLIDSQFGHSHTNTKSQMSYCEHVLFIYYGE